MMMFAQRRAVRFTLLALGLWLLAGLGTGSAADDKGPVVPESDYPKMIDLEVKVLQDALKGIKEAVEELNATKLPPGVKIVPIYDRTDLVNNTLSTVTRTLLEGLVIVVFVLFVFLGSARAAFPYYNVIE